MSYFSRDICSTSKDFVIKKKYPIFLPKRKYFSLNFAKKINVKSSKQKPPKKPPLIIIYFVQECGGGMCRDPCSGFSECGTNAVCRPVNHVATCTCPSGYTALNSPYDACVEENIDLTRLECLTDSDCASGSCFKGICRNP